MPTLKELQAALALAEREREEACSAWRAAHRTFFDADVQVLHARLDLEDALAERNTVRTSDTNRKARP